jgi:hypothetical protein
MHATRGYLRTIRWFLTVRACIAIHRFSPELSDWCCEVTGINEALLSARRWVKDSDRREAGSEPPTALQAKS